MQRYLVRFDQFCMILLATNLFVEQLVDAWERLENYVDNNNVDNKHHNYNYRVAMDRLAPWKERIELCINYTTVCAAQFRAKNESEIFDFVYVDARHDYKGILLDLTEWWPLLRKGGIMAGHDYVTQFEGEGDERD